MSGDHAGVAVRPPALILGALLAACLVELLWPLGPGLARGSPRPVLIGLVIAVLGMGVVARAHRQFMSVGNDVSPRTPTATLVTTGVYAWSRNPVYAGLIVVYFGLVLALTTVWGLLLLPFVIAVLRHAAVLPEEDYLARRFGDAYRDYARKVPRWL